MVAMPVPAEELLATAQMHLENIEKEKPRYGLKHQRFERGVPELRGRIDALAELTEENIRAKNKL